MQEGLSDELGLSADSCARFLAKLRRLDVSVAARTDGRTKEQVQRFIICRLLATLANAGRLHFPISLRPRDKPDFLLSTSDKDIGVEVTEAIHTDYAAHLTSAERQGRAVTEPGHFRHGTKLDKKRSRELNRRLLRQPNLTAEPYYGDQMELEWANFIYDVIKSKLGRLRSSDFEKFGENWLVIYDNLGLPCDRAKAMKCIRPGLTSCWSPIPTFDTIFIEFGGRLACITRAGDEWLDLKDLWRKEC